MSGFVNNSLSSLVASLNVTVLARSLEGRAVFSKFNLKILLFLASRGFLSDIKVIAQGSGGCIYFKFKTTDSGTPIISRVLTPLIKKSKLGCPKVYFSRRITFYLFVGICFNFNK